MNPKLTELLAELDEEIINYETVTLTRREYDLLRSALRDREGMVLVPREPTNEMMEAGYRAVGDSHYYPAAKALEGWGALAKHVYYQMLAAAEEK